MTNRKTDEERLKEQQKQPQAGNQQPGAESKWQGRLDGVIDKILNRDKFSFDLNGDAFHRQYKDQYTRQGKMAMMDTMGQAAALTGGYGSTYAQNVGQQAYQGYLQGLNDRIPELYQLALDTYDREGNNLLNQYGMLADLDNQEYSRGRDAVADQQWQQSFDYGKERDAVSDAQWRESFDYQKNLDGLELEAQKAKAQEANRLAAAQLMAEAGDYSRLAEIYGLSASELAALVKADGEEPEDNTMASDFQRAAAVGAALQPYKDLTVSSGNARSAALYDALGSGKRTSPAFSEGPEAEGDGYEAVDTDATKSFRGSVMTRREYSRTGGSYGSYEDYLEATIDKWLTRGDLTEDDAASLMVYYGLL